MSHLIELPVRAVLDELKRNVGPIGDPRKSQSPNVHGDTPLGALSLVVWNGELVTPARVAEVFKRVRVLNSRDLDSDCLKVVKFKKRQRERVVDSPVQCG